MDNGIEHFDDKRNMNRVAAGFKGGDYFKNLVTVPNRNFVDGWPDTVAQKFMATPIPSIPISDPWVDRRAKGS